MSVDAAQGDHPPRRVPGSLSKGELYWRDRQPWLEKRGYLLRPRYSPDWRPSWEGTKKRFFSCEDGQALHHPSILDATRKSDGRFVMLKKTSKEVHPHEAEIGQYFSSQPLSADARNHCVQIIEVLQDPDEEDTLIIVMPFLREFNDPRFETVGECIEFFRQMFEGLHFMHDNQVAHRDIMELNVMMDPNPMFPDSFHPINQDRKRNFSGLARRFTRTERPTTYLYVDYGHARKYDPADGPPAELPLLGGDKSVPEFQNDGYDNPYNPFPTDIYYLGNLIRQCFLQKYTGLEFMHPLVADMIVADPTKRPTIDQAVERFEEIRRGLTTWRCRARIVSKKEDSVTKLFKDVRHTFQKARYLLKRLPPVPTPGK
ncbi:hypothetical protein IEO21_04978 [Rhodonia placenta]|uniref:Protein kinase domain-containing protein n=1 Tax=Rhodonia placenta TaxID=104341 RepID=A0A8H7U2J2_9APHY|nr:hypothetical protein IEO21_04978 [Postia placenta]